MAQVVDILICERSMVPDIGLQGMRKKELDRIYDIHCHVLFDVDDGAKTLEQSIAMMRIAKEEGICGMILTPHFKLGMIEVGGEVLKAHFEKLQREAEKQNLDMDIYLGGEILYGSEVLESIADGNAFTMAGSRYVLLEFTPSASFSRLQKAITACIQNEYVPILAHVERYECCLADAERIWELKDLGALIQVNADGVLGDHGRLEKKFCKKLLKEELVDFIATDAHRDDRRPPLLKKCVAYIIRKYGWDYADIIFRENPERVIRNEEIGEE